jgi:hypothetical protein
MVMKARSFIEATCAIVTRARHDHRRFSFD